MINAELLRRRVELIKLLKGYRAKPRESGNEEQSRYQDRIMTLEGCAEKEISKLHGIMLAQGWLEPNIHAEAFHRPGVVSRVYKLTPEGNRALLELLASDSGQVLSEEPCESQVAGLEVEVAS